MKSESRPENSKPLSVLRVTGTAVTVGGRWPGKPEAKCWRGEGARGWKNAKAKVVTKVPLSNGAKKNPTSHSPEHPGQQSAVKLWVQVWI